MRMLTYIIRRTILLLPVIIGVMTITFALENSLPVSDQLVDHFGTAPVRDPWVYDPTVPCSDLYPNETGTCTNTIYQHDIKVLGLDQPVPFRWAVFVYLGLTFQWGDVEKGSVVGQTYTWAVGHSVTSVLAVELPYTIELAMFALVLILAIAIPLGNLSAVNRNRPVDQASRVMSFSGYALPAFLLGTLALMGLVLLVGAWNGSYASVHTPWCPSGESVYDEFSSSWPVTKSCVPTWVVNGLASKPTGFPTVDAIIHGNNWLALDTVLRMALPALVIAFGTVAGLLRFVRNSMLEVMNLDFIRTARAKGVAERTVVSRHAGRNSLNVTITVLGLTFAGFIGGFPVIESVFGLNGVGFLLAIAIQAPADYAVIFGSTLLFTYLVVFANMIVDVLYAFLDPRVRLG